ncbi:MAG: hypothetical protein DMG06_14450, partial [Acidobacteria bacterium]
MKFYRVQTPRSARLWVNNLAFSDQHNKINPRGSFFLLLLSDGNRGEPALKPGVIIMKASNPFWKERLVHNMPEALSREIDIYETEIDLRKQGKVEERLFAETRLRRGVYGQRYDNGQRHDGKKVQRLAYPSDQTKGPHTLWDAPGMQRIKIPYGGLNAKQLEVLADLAE